MQSFLGTQCALIRSRGVLEIALAEEGIRDLATFAPGVDAVEQLQGLVNATQGRRDDLITIAVRTREPSDAPKIANAIVIAFTKFHAGAQRSDARQLTELLQSSKKQIDKQLDEKRKAWLEFKTKHASFSFGTQRVSPTVEALSTLSSEYTRARLNVLNAQAAFDTARKMMDDPAKVRQLLDSRRLNNESGQLRSEMRDLQLQVSGLTKTYGPEAPRFIAVLDRVKQLEIEMQQADRAAFNAYLAELEQKLAEATQYEAQIMALRDRQQTEVASFNTADAQFQILDEEYTTAKKFSDQLGAQISQLGLTEDTGSMIVNSVESAVRSSQVEPNASSTMLFALIMGALAGAGLAFLRDLMDQRLRSVDEVKQVTGLPVLGIVPHIAAGNNASERGTHLQNDPMSDVAEAYRTVRTAVYFGQGGAVAKTLVITSPAPGDGKTTLAANLATAMAQAGHRILLLDADFRKPTQHKIFQIDKRLGLSSVLAGEAALADVIHRSRVPGLDVLPCGPIPANPSEILNSQTFADILNSLTQQYDHVLLDSPPVIPVTDARILAASCDATLLAIRAERTTRKNATYARDLLLSVGAQMLGVVVNDVPRRKGVYGYYYTYGGQYYQYGYGPKKSLPSNKPKPAGEPDAVPPPTRDAKQA
jgi:capsular exopolysaccharide synthesis family protein